MKQYEIKKVNMEDGETNYVILEDGERLVAQFATKREAEEVLVRYLSAVDGMA